jgi:hypothetical protein
MILVRDDPTKFRNEEVDEIQDVTDYSVKERFIQLWENLKEDLREKTFYLHAFSV